MFPEVSSVDEDDQNLLDYLIRKVEFQLEYPSNMTTMANIDAHMEALHQSNRKFEEREKRLLNELKSKSILEPVLLDASTKTEGETVTTPTQEKAINPIEYEFENTLDEKERIELEKIRELRRGKKARFGTD